MAYNKVILMGRLTKEPEIKQTQAGKEIARLTIAVDRRYQKQGEEKVADFFPCIAFGGTARFIGEYFGKGQMIHLSGSVQNRSWTDTEGRKHTVTEIVCEDVDFCGDAPKKGSGEAADFMPIDCDDGLPY